jgi:hypothetical protein
VEKCLYTTRTARLSAKGCVRYELVIIVRVEGAHHLTSKTFWRAPRDRDSADLITNGGVGCGVRPGFFDIEERLKDP